MWKNWFILWTFETTLLRITSAEPPKFRILAPEFICPKDENAPIEKPDDTIITLQTPAGANFDVHWSVRWTPLVPPPTQRFVLLLWKTVRALEVKLNGAQAEPYVYVIPNSELLHGVVYEFTVSAVEDGEVSSPKTFRIDNTEGQTKLDMVEGRGDLIYVTLLGAQVAYADTGHVLEAQFIWTVRSHTSDDVVDVSTLRGSRLVIPPYTLKSGLEYDAECQVMKQSTGLRITQTGLPFQVLKRGIKVFLNVDYLVIPVNYPFTIEAQVFNPDYYGSTVTFEWECNFEETACDEFDNSYNNTLFFPAGLSKLGEHQIKLTVNIQDETAETSAVVKTVEQTLPVVQIKPVSRVINEGSIVNLVANASNVAPTCTLTWYFASVEFLSGEVEVNGTCDDCQHGEPLSDTLTIFSLEENFLTELADFTNETEWRQVSGEIAAKPGRARFMVTCGCSATFQCTTQGTVYADLLFEVNESPKPGRVKITPQTGVALETIFRISTLAVVDPDVPLRYSFHCRVGNDDSLLLGSFVDYLAVETFLPYVDGGTDVWVQVCDSLGACSTGEPTTVVLNPGEGSTVDLIIEEVKGHSRRCEMEELNRDAVAAMVTYTNTEKPDLLSKFTSELQAALPPDCLTEPEQYTTFLHWLATHGVDTNSTSS
ncbi:REJ domain-containing protein [Phthorimaea operculella]|nr:REJ domain-containing protein [Phthorimaea operculella]